MRISKDLKDVIFDLSWSWAKAWVGKQYRYKWGGPLSWYHDSKNTLEIRRKQVLTLLLMEKLIKKEKWLARVSIRNRIQMIKKYKANYNISARSTSTMPQGRGRVRSPVKGGR